jgi:predicted transcriptional regulator
MLGSMAKTSPRPTDAELEILSVLWEHGPSTVREVHQTLLANKPAGYTTVLKIMQIMAEKGLVRRDETARAHIYHARQPREQTERQLLGHLVDRVFSGSASRLVMRALASRKASPEELSEIRGMLDELEGNAK